MTAQVRFIRGAAGASLPAQYQDGTIFVIDRDGEHGDIYVDVENSKRLHITPDSPIVHDTKAAYATMTSTQSKRGTLYIVTDYKEKTDQPGSYIPGVKIGDGNAYIASLPILELVTAEEKDFWNNKVAAYSEHLEGSDYNLVLTTGVIPN